MTQVCVCLCVCQRMPSPAVPNPSQIEVSGAIGGSRCVYNLIPTPWIAEIGWCCLIGSGAHARQCVGIRLVQRTWDEVKVLNTCVRSRRRDENQLAVVTLFPGWVHIWDRSRFQNWVAVVIVTTGCSQRPSASCRRVAMAMAGCSVGVLLW